MTGIEERTANDLFRFSPTNAKIQVQFVELAGKVCKDLLEKGEVKVMDQPDGSIRLINAASREVRSPEDLSSVIARGKRRRATEATDKNGVSSRSHAVLQITIMNEEDRGVLLLIDCAGSERRNDSLYHSQQRQKESVEINASLWALKECIRARLGSKASTKVVPYRASNLTRILKESLERNDAELAVIATIAPNATDTEHTLETLKTVSNLIGTDSSPEKSQFVVDQTKTEQSDSLIPPKNWSSDQLQNWMSSKKLDAKKPNRSSCTTGKDVMRMSSIQLKNMFYGKEDAGKAMELFRALREESDRVSRLRLKERLANRN